VIGIEAETRLVLLLVAKAEEALDGRVTVRAFLPSIGGLPLELRAPAAASVQRLDVDAVVYLRMRCGHGEFLALFVTTDPTLKRRVFFANA
jgi:hypothetical protein